MLTTDQNDPKFWGRGIESAEERIEWKRTTPPWRWSGVDLYPESPFVRKFKGALEAITRLIEKDGVLPGNREIMEVRAVSEPIRGEFYYHSYRDELELAMTNFEDLEILLRRVEDAMDNAIRRARSRKEEIRYAKLSMVERREELRTLYDSLSPIHLTLNAHFGAQVLEMPRKDSHEGTVAAQFYEPLYTLRDSFFRKPETSTLKEYLRQFEIIVKERYYHEELLETRDLKKLREVQDRVNSLTDDLEVYVLMEEAK